MPAILIKLLWIFLWKYSTKNCGKIFFLNKTKTEAFLDKYGHTYWEILQKKTKKKKNLRQILFDLGQLEALRSTEDIVKLDTVAFDRLLWAICMANVR